MADFPRSRSPSLRSSLEIPFQFHKFRSSIELVSSSATNIVLSESTDLIKMGFALVKPAGVPGKSWPAIVIGMFVAFGGVLFG